jgi:hypothetical protein
MNAYLDILLLYASTDSARLIAGIELFLTFIFFVYAILRHIKQKSRISQIILTSSVLLLLGMFGLFLQKFNVIFWETHRALFVTVKVSATVILIAAGLNICRSFK